MEKNEIRQIIEQIALAQGEFLYGLDDSAIESKLQNQKELLAYFRSARMAANEIHFALISLLDKI